MYFLDLPQEHQVAWLCAIALTGIGSILHHRERHGMALLALIAAAFILRLSATLLDPFLHIWDEIFHAVVARNLVEHPLTPMLHHEPAMPIDKVVWPHQHIWLHKPPFFMWLMALSMKFFGVAPWVVRLPSAIILTALVPATYRMGVILHDRRTGFAAAALVANAFLLQQLTAGRISTDHNDAVFIGMTGLGLWALFEYLRTRKPSWALLMGAFSTMAILTKWYVGLLPFLPMGILWLQRPGELSLLKHLLLALCVPVVLVGAWLLHIHDWFPAEAAAEARDGWLHILIPFEGHRGTWHSHFTVIATLVPPFTWWLVLPAFILLVKDASPMHRIVLVSVMAGVHIFFVIAQTKMIAYTMILLPLYMLAMGHLFARLVGLVEHPTATMMVRVAGLVLLSLAALDPNRIAEPFGADGPLNEHQAWRRQRLAANAALDHLVPLLQDPERAAVFGLPLPHYLDLYFEHRIPAWDALPSNEDVHRLQQHGYTVHVVQDGRPLEQLPEQVVIITDSMLILPRIRRL